MFRKRLPRSKRQRQGAVTVEFAVVAPVFLVIILGIAEASRLFDLQNQLSTACREGARLASMDRDGMDMGGRSTNEKVTDDVKNFLAANGISTDDIEVVIADANNAAKEFDLDDPDNDLELFQLQIRLPYKSVNTYHVPGVDDAIIGGKVVFRNGRSVIVQ